MAETLNLLRQAKTRALLLGVEHTVYRPPTSNKAIQRRFQVMQDTIREHKIRERPPRPQPYLTLQPATESQTVGDTRAPSPRHSEHILNPALSQTLRKQTDKEISYKVAMYARPTRLKTNFKPSTLVKFNSNYRLETRSRKFS